MLLAVCEQGEGDPNQRRGGFRPPNNSVHNDSDEGFIDEIESTSSNTKLAKSRSTSEEVPSIKTTKNSATGPNVELSNSATKALRFINYLLE